MGFDPKVRSEELLSNEDRRWLGTRDGTTNQRSITLDPALFTADHLINGSLRSGTVLAKVDATGFYGPYDNAAVDGRGVARGHLYSTLPFVVGASGVKVGVALWWFGVCIEAFLPAFVAATGKIDAAARADLGTFIRYEAA